MENAKKFDLEERLIAFSLLDIEIVELLPGTKVGNHIAGQMLRWNVSGF